MGARGYLRVESYLCRPSHLGLYPVTQSTADRGYPRRQVQFPVCQMSDYLGCPSLHNANTLVNSQTVGRPRKNVWSHLHGSALTRRWENGEYFLGTRSGWYRQGGGAVQSGVAWHCGTGGQSTHSPLNHHGPMATCRKPFTLITGLFNNGR